MTKKPEKSEFGDLVVVATLDDIEKGAQRIIGSRMKVIDEKEDVRIFSDISDTCPLQVVATLIQKGIYRLDVRSQCTIKNCDYFAECSRLDARAAKSLGTAMADILGEQYRVYEGRIWRPERLQDDKRLQKIIDRIINDGQ